MLTGQYLELWLDTFVQPFRAASTTAGHRRAIASLPIGVTGCDLASLDGLVIQAALNQQALKHPRAAQLTFATLHVAMNKAVQLGYIPRNPVDACIKPAHTPRKAQVLSIEQLAAYIQAARSEATFPLLLLIATLGLRRSEALGLQWSCIDLASGILHIRQQRLRINGRQQLMPLKSRASNRKLPVSAPILEELRAFRHDQRIFSLSGFIVDTNPDTLRKAHMRVIARAGLPHVTLHGMRHTVATAAAASGCPMKILQGILGHSTFALTANLYADHLEAIHFAQPLTQLASVVLG